MSEETIEERLNALPSSWEEVTDDLVGNNRRKIRMVYFDDVRDLLALARADGAKEERAAVVEYLRRRYKMPFAIDNLNNGEHRKATT